MARDRSPLEPLADGFTAFETADGERWKHKDVEASRVGPGYRLFVNEHGERRRCDFGPNEPHDVTLSDLREQLKRAKPVVASADNARSSGEARP